VEPVRVVLAATVGQLKRRWSVTTKATADLCTLNSPPLVANGRLFTTAPTGVAAYGATTGKRLWQWTFPVRGERFGELVLGGGLLVALTTPCVDGPGQNAYLTALDPVTGARKWRLPLDRHTGTLVVDRGVAAVGDARSTTGYRVSDGAQRWKVAGYRLAITGRKLQVTQLASHGGQPVRAGDLLYLTVDSMNPIAILEPATGSTVAAYPEMKLLAQPPVIVNGWLYTTDGETLRGYTS
jgi:outer membrane protein assembly factor BamB